MKSIWREISELPKFPQLKQDIHTDVLIIGGGIAGILTAYFLKQNGMKYVLVEKDRICCGTTQNTTAKITYQHGLIYSEILKTYGLETAQKYLDVNRKAFNKYGELCKNIDCDYEIKDNYVYSVNDRNKLEEEMSALAKIGFNVEFCPKINLPLNTAGTVKLPRQAQFHPLKFLGAVRPDYMYRQLVKYCVSQECMN